MTPERLQEILDAYGASPERWPADERAAAEALLARAPAGRCDAAARLDALLGEATVELPSAALVARVLAAAPAAHKSARRGGRRWPAVAAVVSLAAAASFAFWLTATPERGPARVRGYRIDELGTYATATDVLLESPGVDVLDTVPTLGCSGNGGLGCPDIEIPRDSMLRPEGSLHA